MPHMYGDLYGVRSRRRRNGQVFLLQRKIYRHAAKKVQDYSKGT